MFKRQIVRKLEMVNHLLRGSNEFLLYKMNQMNEEVKQLREDIYREKFRLQYRRINP